MFNKGKRTDNAVKTSLVSSIVTVFNSLSGFIYRTAFLYFLSKQYLGINGLFVNVLQILSLADLGIAGAIVFRFYKPIAEEDFRQVGKLMNYFKKVYRIIFFVVVCLGVLLIPFLGYFIKDMSEVPADVNIYVVYVLFLLQTASSYVYAYKQTLLTADQRQYIVSIVQAVTNIIKYVLQIISLWIFKDYMLTIVINIATTIGINYIFSLYVTKRYPEVFSVKESISREERNAILKDTKACMGHKIGFAVVNSTDNLILSSFVGIAAVGIYSNYSLLISSLDSVATQLLSNSTASIGNAYVQMDEDNRYRVYKNMLYINWSIDTILTACLYVLITPFITLWIGGDMTFGNLTVILLCIKFYLTLSRQINMSTTSADGLFVKDVPRPFIEATINLVTSIFLVNKIGIAGIFMGTISSCLCTVWWREPYLLFKYDFKRSMFEYWGIFFKFVSITIIASGVCQILLVPFIHSFISWIFVAILTAIISIIFIVLVNFRKEEFINMVNLIFRIVRKRKR